MQVGLWEVKTLKDVVIENGVARFTAEWADTIVDFQDIRGPDILQQSKELITRKYGEEEWNKQSAKGKKGRQVLA